MLKENSFEENFEEKQRRIFFLSLFKIRFNCVLTFTLANTSKSQYGVKFSPTNGGQKRIVEEGGGEKNSFELTISLSSEVFETLQRTSIVDFLVPPPILSIPNPFSSFPPPFFPLSPLSLSSFFLSQTRFTRQEGIPTESNISHRRTAERFQRLAN